LQSFLDLAERQVLGERTKAILTRHPLAVAVALAPATIAPARPQPELLFAVARQDQLQSRFRFDLALHEEAIAKKWDPLTMETL
jgi:hypothetical protein